MSLPSITAEEAFAGYDFNGDPQKVDLEKVMEWATGIERISGVSLSSRLVFATYAELAASIAHDANTMAWVIGDPTPASNGIYRKVGASGAGWWVRVAELPYSFITALNEGAGTANAIQATTTLGVNSGQLIALPIDETNDGSPVTVSFDGGDPLTIKTQAGSDVPVGGLVAPNHVLGFIRGSIFQLASDIASSSIQSAAEAAVLDAEAARDAALAAMSSVITTTFPDRATAEAYAPEIPPEFIALAGEDEVGDGGQLLYARQNSEPSDEPKFSITLDDGVSVVWYAPALASGNIPATAADPQRFALIHRAARQKNALLVMDQPLSTVYDRMKLAVEGSHDGDTIVGESGAILDMAALDPITLKSGTTYRGNRMLWQLTQDRGSASLMHHLRCEDNGYGIAIHDFWIDAGGYNSNANAALLSGTGCHGIEVFRPRIKGWARRAIDFYSSSQRGISGILIDNARMWAPLKGLGSLGHPVIFRSGIGGFRGSDCWVTNGWFRGSDPYNPVIAEWTEAKEGTVGNETTADFLVWQGIVGGGLLDSIVIDSGRAGTSQTRGSESLLTKNFTAWRTHEPGLNWGSGFDMMYVEDITGFTVTLSDDYDNATNGVRSTAGGVTGGRVSMVVPDTTGTGGWVGVDAINSGIFELGDDISQLGTTADTVVGTAPVGQREAGRSVIYSAFDMVGVGVHCIDSNIPSAGSYAINAIRARGRSLISHSSYSRPESLGNAAGFLSNSHSVIGLGDGNYWLGRPVDDSDLSNSGAYTWLFKQTNRVGFVARAQTSSVGNIVFGKGLSCSKGSTGVYNYTLLSPLSNANYQAIVTFTTANRRFEVTYTSGSAFTITTRDSAGSAADVAHEVAVLR